MNSDNSAPPSSVDVVVIGGGIVGCSAAWFLAKRGLKVALCEKGRIAGEQSGRNWGFVRQQGRDAEEMPMMIDSLRIWRGLEDEIGEDVGFTQSGTLYLARDVKELDARSQWLAVAEKYQIDAKVVTGAALDTLLDGGGDRWAGGVFTASDGCAEPTKAGPAIARAAARLGVFVLTNCAVRGVETEAGRVAAVVTERGRIRTSAAVCAAGAWSSLFSGNLDISVPQLKVRATVARTAPAPNITDCSTWSPEVAIRRRQDGGYTVATSGTSEYPITPDSFRYFRLFLRAFRADSASLRLQLDHCFMEEFRTPRRWPLDAPTVFEKTRILNPAPSPRILRDLRKSLGKWFPELSDIPFVESWAGMIEATPDTLPIICEAETLPGYFIATGFSGHGFGIGPGAGHAIADLVTSAPGALDLNPFRLTRFFDGSPLKASAAV